MNFLAIDTSGAHLSVVAYKNGEAVKTFLPDCATRHSVVLMDEIERTLEKAGLSVAACDFFAVCVGAGSFTGIRIGIATVKGLCFARGKKALAITSFDCLAYSENNGKVLAFVDAGHGNFYAAGYENGELKLAPQFCSGEEVTRLIGEGYAPIATTRLFEGVRAVDPCEGLKNAVLKKQGELISPEELIALYLRKSSAEEQRL